MGNMNIVTGQTGSAHITSADQASFHVGAIGSGEVVLALGEKFEAEIVSNNKVKVLDGDAYFQGRHVRVNVDNYIELTVENGAQSVNRNDLIVIRYAKDEDTSVESADLVVIKGTAGEEATDPSVTTGDIRSGDTVHEMPLYRLKIEGLTLTEIEPLFETRDSLQGQLDSITLATSEDIQALFEDD